MGEGARGATSEMAADPDSVAQPFMTHYYQTFDTNRPALSNLHKNSSILSFEGAKAIVAKLTGPSFQQYAHQIYTNNCQFSDPTVGMIVCVFESLQLTDIVWRLRE